MFVLPLPGGAREGREGPAGQGQEPLSGGALVELQGHVRLVQQAFGDNESWMSSCGAAGIRKQDVICDVQVLSLSPLPLHLWRRALHLSSAGRPVRITTFHAVFAVFFGVQYFRTSVIFSHLSNFQTSPKNPKKTQKKNSKTPKFSKKIPKNANKNQKKKSKVKRIGKHKKRPKKL